MNAVLTAIEALDMSENDIDNLKFLVTASAETLRDWYFSVEKDDIEYAQELLDEAQRQIEEMSDDDPLAAELRTYLKEYKLQ